jgi:hypothetical protein
MNYVKDTKTLDTPNGYTDSMSAKSSLSTAQAHRLLDQIKEGLSTPAHIINQALKKTGDLNFT